MPRLPFARTRIELPVADRRHHDTLIRQKATFLALDHTQAANGECLATVTVEVTMYAADGEGFGPALTGAGFSSYTAVLVADNNTLVNAQTGAILAIRAGQNDEAWAALGDEFEEPTLLQGDFFEYLRENQGIIIGDLIRQHIQQADAMGRFA